MLLKRGLLSSITFATIALGALAAQAQSVDWNGPYLGGHVGWVKGNVDSEANFSGTLFTWETDPSGVAGGVVGGYNRQNGDWVYGVDADFGLSNADDCFSDNDTRACDDIEWTSHIRARIGKAFGNALIFAAGGLAIARVEHSDTDVDGSAGFVSASQTDTRVGFTLGGGVEVAYGKSWTARLEYLYDDLGEETLNLAPASEFGVQKRDLTIHTIRGAVAWRF